MQAIECMIEFCYKQKYAISDNGEGVLFGQVKNEFTQHYHAARIAIRYGVYGMKKYALQQIEALLPPTFEALSRPNDSPFQQQSPGTLTLDFLHYVVPTWHSPNAVVVPAPKLSQGSGRQSLMKDPISVTICKAVADLWAKVDDQRVVGPSERSRIRNGLQELHE